jgi:hypothetical protein
MPDHTSSASVLARGLAWRAVLLLTAELEVPPPAAAGEEARARADAGGSGGGAPEAAKEGGGAPAPLEAEAAASAEAGTEATAVAAAPKTAAAAPEAAVAAPEATAQPPTRAVQALRVRTTRVTPHGLCGAACTRARSGFRAGPKLRKPTPAELPRDVATLRPRRAAGSMRAPARRRRLACPV